MGGDRNMNNTVGIQRGGTLYTYIQRLQFHYQKKQDFNRQVKPKKKISPHSFTFLEHRGGYERLITQPYKLPQLKSSAFFRVGQNTSHTQRKSATSYSNIESQDMALTKEVKSSDVGQVM